MYSDNSSGLVTVEQIVPSLFIARGQFVLLDCDLAALCGATTKQLHERLARSFAHFPAAFMFQLSAQELGILAAKFVSFSACDDDVPYAFTEHGVLMAAMAFDTPQTIEIGVQVVRAFIQMRDEVRQWLASNAELALQVAQLKQRVEGHDFIVDILETFCELLKAPDALHLTDAQHAELNRLLEQYEKNRDAGSPWPQVKGRILKRG
jgi:putative addiction module component (TIGR02574 family)